ncbi:MAG: carbamoyl phosphate synthase small subunit, partial [Blautia massiliensis (ex Durand et al. 2017)]
MQAYLILANGRVFRGQSIGCPGTTIGEVVFATGMVGFEETLTDPSYYGQIITQTYPLIGNYGMNHEDVESGRIWARGYIVREACKTPSNFRSEMTLDAFLKQNGIIGIEGVDTRSLTRTLRESGVMNGAITTEFDPEAEPEKTAALLPQISAYAVTGAVAAVTCKKPETYEPTAPGRWGDTPLHVALLDLGCKNNIVRCLQKRGCRVTVLPGTATAADLAALAPDGLMLSNAIHLSAWTGET